MRKIKVVVNGIIEDGALEIAQAIENSFDMELMQGSVTRDADIDVVLVNGLPIKLFSPHQKNDMLLSMGDKHPDVVIDFSRTSVVKENVDFYTKLRMPFVMGTTLAPGDVENALKAIRLLYKKE